MINSDLFKGFSDENFSKFIDESKAFYRDFNKSSYVFSHGEKLNYIFVLIRGRLSIEKFDIKGKKSIVNIFSNPGDVLGEVYAYLSKDSDFNLICLENSRLLYIPVGYFSFFEDLSEERRMALENLMTIMADKAYFLSARVRTLSAYSLRQKICSYIMENKEGNLIELSMNREELSDFLGVSRPSLSRELSRMEGDGMIEICPGWIKILDEDKILEIL